MHPFCRAACFGLIWAVGHAQFVRETDPIAMSKSFSRRRLLGAALAAGVLPILPGAVRAAPAIPKRLVAGTRVLEVNGWPAKVFALTGLDGRPGLRLAPGERFRVHLVNQTGTRTILHLHGQLPPWVQDCIPWPQAPPLPTRAPPAPAHAPSPGT